MCVVSPNSMLHPGSPSSRSLRNCCAAAPHFLSRRDQHLSLRSDRDSAIPTARADHSPPPPPLSVALPLGQSRRAAAAGAFRSASPSPAAAAVARDTPRCSAAHQGHLTAPDQPLSSETQAVASQHVAHTARRSHHTPHCRAPSLLSLVSVRSPLCHRVAAVHVDRPAHRIAQA